MSKHTKGPWQHKPNDPKHRDGDYMVWGPKGPGYGIVCHVSPYGMPSSEEVAEQMKADAKLIAKTPEMYEALKKIKALNPINALIKEIVDDALDGLDDVE